MADGDGPIASAVIIPDTEELQPPPSKRPRSSTSESTSKRPRLSYDANSVSPTALRESPQPIEPSKIPTENAKGPIDERRKSSVQEERKRGQRLFGGLLSTLSQSTPNGQQKRRLEIEKRQQEKAKQQKAEDEVRRGEKLAKLKAIRKVEQIKFDEETMRIRHANMLAMARYLYTKSEPRLYYIPWKLRPEDEEHIVNQVTEVQIVIDREVAEFQKRNSKEKPEIKSEPQTANGTSKETVGEPATESPVFPALVDTTNRPTQARQSDQVKTEKQALEEHNGEVVVENEEDTVIY